MKKKIALLTFDYELFLGGLSGTVKSCLIHPTNKLLEIAEKQNVSYIFFVDTTYLMRMREIQSQYEAVRLDLESIVEQLKKVIEKGHRVFHHLHPHWLDAQYIPIKNQWDLSNKTRFALSNLDSEHISSLFKDSVQIISELYTSKSQLLNMGYRAGGLYAQPFNNFRSEFLKYNILYDFSVLQNSFSKPEGKSYYFDYLEVPDELIYNFDMDLTLKKENGPFIEFAINQLKLSGFNKIINGVFYRLNKNKSTWQKMGDGKASGNKIQVKKKKIDFLSKFTTLETYSVELLNSYKKNVYLKAFEKNSLIHIISHPKLVSNHNLFAFETMLERLNKKYVLITDLSLIKDEYLSK